MATFTINGTQYASLAEARKAAGRMNSAAPETEIAIKRDGKLAEIWVGPVTFMPAGSDAYIAYSAADADTIGAVRKAGSVYSAGSRGFDVGAFASLFDAAHALHDHALSRAYKRA